MARTGRPAHTHAVLVPSADAFAALARSSPWRWTTLRFAFRRRQQEEWEKGVRAWLRRPGFLRVEAGDGRLLQVDRGTQTAATAVLSAHGGRPVRLLRPGDAGFPEPELRPDGLVAVRPWMGSVDYDDPMFVNYFWVALLDPAELADGLDADHGTPGSGPLVEELTEVEHFGRPAWEAVVRPTSTYAPRCSCCPLLPSREADLLEFGPEGVRDGYPEAYRVRLDVGTGVCVLSEALDGSPRGDGHELLIEAVDVPMPDRLFRR
jgi:hypothetical protein